MAGVGLRVLAAQAGGDGLKIVLRFRHGDSGPKAANYVERVIRAVRSLFDREIERHPSLGADGKVEIRRHDADDPELLTTQQHALTNNGGVGAKVPLPETVAEDNDVVVPCPETISDNVAAQLGRYSQQRKEVGRDLATRGAQPSPSQ